MDKTTIFFFFQKHIRLCLVTFSFFFFFFKFFLSFNTLAIKLLFFFFFFFGLALNFSMIICAKKKSRILFFFFSFLPVFKKHFFIPSTRLCLIFVKLLWFCPVNHYGTKAEKVLRRWNWMDSEKRQSFSEDNNVTPLSLPFLLWLPVSTQFTVFADFVSVYVHFFLPLFYLC